MAEFLCACVAVLSIAVGVLVSAVRRHARELDTLRPRLHRCANMVERHDERLARTEERAGLPVLRDPEERPRAQA